MYFPWRLVPHTDGDSVPAAGVSQLVHRVAGVVANPNDVPVGFGFGAIVLFSLPPKFNQ